MNRVDFTPDSVADLLDIFEFGIERFGSRQAARYQADLDTCFSRLAMHPRMGRQAHRLGKGVRRHEHGSHVIFYEAADSSILILAVVHNRSLHHLRLADRPPSP